jgi:hypothetical protein
MKPIEAILWSILNCAKILFGCRSVSRWVFPHSKFEHWSVVFGENSRRRHRNKTSLPKEDLVVDFSEDFWLMDALLTCLLEARFPDLVEATLLESSS